MDMLLVPFLNHTHQSAFYTNKRLALRVAGLLALGAVLFILPAWVASLSTFLAVLLAWLWFMLPGFLLSQILINSPNWLERIPIAFVLSLGLATPYTVIAILFRMHLDQYLGLSLLMFGLVVVLDLVYHLRLRRGKIRKLNLGAPSKLNPGLVIFWIVISLGVAGLAFISSQWPPAGDDLAGLPYFAEVLRLGQITGSEPFHGTDTPVTPRNELIVWGYQNILVNKIAATSPVETLQNNRPIFIVISFLAFYTFLRHFFKQEHLVLFLLSLWTLYLLASLHEDGMGSNLVTRIIQDKFIGWFIVVPIVLVIMFWTLEKGHYRLLVAFAIAALGATLLHPITLSTILILSSSYGFFYVLFESSKKAFLRTMLVGLVLGLCLLIPIYQYIRFNSIMPVDLIGLRNSIDYGRLSMAIGRNRLWLLENNQFIVHPDIVLQPEVLVGIGLLPFLVPLLHRSNAARLLLGASIFLLLFLYFPPLAMLIGKFVTPYLMWRLAWPIPALAVFTIGWVTWALASLFLQVFMKKDALRFEVLHYGLTIALIFGAGLISYPQIESGAIGLSERYQAEAFSTCSQAQRALAYLDQLTQDEPANVLASRSLNFCIPGYAALANVVEFRGFGTLNRLDESMIDDSLQRVTDINYFSSTTQVDELVITMLERWDIDYLMVEKERLELLFHLEYLPDLFPPLYSDADYAIFAISRPFLDDPSVTGFTALSEREWNEAETTFRQMILEGTNPALAYYGLALALENQGDLEQALAVARAAVEQQPDQAALHAQLAGTYLLFRDPENAVQSYLQAISLAPGFANLYTGLGFSYRLAGQPELALVSYAQAAALQAKAGTAAYYSLLADMLAAANWPAAAVDNYHQAIAIAPDSTLFAKLAPVLAAIGDQPGAIDADRKAIQLDPWASTPRVHLGSLYLAQGLDAQAISEFERAWRTNPSNITAIMSLASAIRTVSGVDAAITRMQTLSKINALLPGPHRALDLLYRASGNQEAAIAELNASLQIQFGDPAIITILGDLARDMEEYTEAESYYLEALEKNLELPAARVGLSYLYGLAGEHGPQRGQYYRLARAYPAAAWPHYLLASNYRNRGNLEIALQEIRWALVLEPNNASGYVQLGDLYHSVGRYTDAVTQYQEALTLQPNLADAYLNLASTYLQLERPDQARKTLETALSQSDEIALIHTALANLAFTDQDTKLANWHYQQAIEFDDSLVDAYLGLTKLSLFLDDSRAARETLQLATENIPDDFVAFDVLAELETAAGNPEAALDWLWRGIQANPQAAIGYQNLADEYRRLGQLDQAVVWYQKTIVLDERNLNAYLNLAAIYEQMAANEVAEDIYLALLDKVPYSNSAYLSLGNLYVKMGRFDQAADVYQTALANPPLIPAVYLALSNLYIIQDDWESAITILEQGFEALPTSSEAAFNLANIYRQRGDLERAQGVYEQVLAINPSIPGIYLGLAQLAQQQGETQAAGAWLELAVSANPRSVEADLNLANFYESQGANEDAELLFQQALELDPFSTTTILAVGEFYLRQGQVETALQTFEHALAYPPHSVALYLGIGDAYAALQQPEDALHWYQAARDLNATDITPYLTISSYYQELLNWDQALASLVTALQRQPGNASLHMALGNLYLKMEQDQQAALEFQLACELEPLRTDCRISLANLFAVDGRWEDAIPQYQMALELDPAALSIYSTLARAYVATNQPSAATQTFSQAVQKNPDQPAAWLARAAYFASRHNWDQALINYQSAWQRFPADQEVGRQLALFYQQRGDLAAARTIIESLLALSEVEAATVVASGDLYAHEAQWEPAIAAYHQAIQQDPNTSAAYTGLASIYLLQGQIDQALSVYQEAVSVIPDDVQVYLTLGDVYLARLDFNAARSMYERAFDLTASFNTSAYAKLDNLSLKMDEGGLDLTPMETFVRANPNASNYAAVAYRYQLRGDWQTAEQWYHQGLELESDNGTVWLTFGNFLRSRQDWPAALDALQKAVQFSPDPAAWLALGAVYEALEMPEDALAAYEIAAEMDRSLISPYVSLAKWHAVQGHSALALDLLIQGIHVVPGDASGYEALGQIYLSLGQIDLAMDSYQAGLQVIPGAAALYIGLAGFMGDQLVAAQETILLAEALRDYAQNQLDRVLGDTTPEQVTASQSELDQAEARLTDAQVQYNAAMRTYETITQDFETAQSYYKKALEIQPDNVFALVGLGDLYRDFNRTDEALASYQQAVAANPNHVAALNALANAYLANGQAEDALLTFERALAYSPNNLGTFYGILSAHNRLDALNAGTSADAIRYSQYWWVYYIRYFRNSEAQRLAR